MKTILISQLYSQIQMDWGLDGYEVEQVVRKMPSAGAYAVFHEDFYHTDWKLFWERLLAANPPRLTEGGLRYTRGNCEQFAAAACHFAYESMVAAEPDLDAFPACFRVHVEIPRGHPLNRVYDGGHATNYRLFHRGDGLCYGEMWEPQNGIWCPASVLKQEGIRLCDLDN